MLLMFKAKIAPVGQPRARATATKAGRARMYSPTQLRQADGSSKAHPIVAFKAAVRAAVAGYQGPPLEGPLCLDVVAVFPRPSRLVWKTKPMPRVPHIVKPDRDNVDKAVMDALNGRLWVDDCQVCDGRIQKFIAAGNEAPHVLLTLRRVTA